MLALCKVSASEKFCASSPGRGRPPVRRQRVGGSRVLGHSIQGNWRFKVLMCTQSHFPYGYGDPITFLSGALH